MNNSHIQILNLKSNYPTLLTDRWGDYMERTVLAEHWNVGEEDPAMQAYELLRGRYDSGEHDSDGNPLHHGFSIGDPRAFLAEESCYVAFYENRIGIHAEVELDVEFNDLDDAAAVEDTDEEITREEFEKLVERYTPKLQGLAEIYPETRFFIAHGEDVTYRGRVTLNAFTPLLNGRLPEGTTLAPQSMALMLSPYFRKGPDAGAVNIAECPCLTGITDNLIDMTLN